MSGPSASSTSGTPSVSERLSPVLITKSGRSPASDWSQRCFLRWPLTMWMSETWRTRNGRIPGGSTGTVTRRSLKERTSIPAA